MAKKKRSLFNLIFGNNHIQPGGEATQLKMLNGYMPVFSQFGNEAYSSDIVRAAVDAIARNGAKLVPKHIRKTNENVTAVHDNIENLLQIQPNPFMDAYTFYYKVITQLYIQNNSFIYIDYGDLGNIRGFYPINASTTELLEYQGEIYAKFHFLGGQKITLAYTELIHLRRFFYKNDFYGEPNDHALYPTLELINTTDQGIINAVKSSAFLRGLLKFTTTLRQEDMTKQKNKFMEEYMNINNSGGVAATDAKADYIPLNSEPKLINSPQMDLIEQKVYKYFGVSKEIVMSNYDENQWNAFYESVIEPIAIQMSLQFTSKIFSPREKGFGNEIIFESNRLAYASNRTKTLLIQQLMPMGVLSINEAREILNMAPVEDGDKRIVSLNYVSADKADKYQGVEGDDNNDN
ncbi:phage portal protein [Marinisporobacter balticus]|uniref:phage portal protein n=1 Tax=Marinisporobacter balticus TaxID=2018667 RepID=UPI0014044884|nr:phage portal protein [Marinisporobacter balticus]